MIAAKLARDRLRLVPIIALGLATGDSLAFARSNAAQPLDRQRRAMEQLELSCDRCHACAEPSPLTPCLRTCTRTEQRRIEREFASKRGPKIVILDDLEDIYLPVPFDHEGHALMAQMAGGCVLCHHYTPEGLEHPACRTCHEGNSAQGDVHKPGLKGAYHRQCMGCHREWSGDTRCGVCHHAKAGGARTGVAQPLPTPDDLIGRMHPPIPEPNEEVYRARREGFPPTNVLFRHKHHISAYGLRCAECHREDGCNRCHEAGKEHTQKVRSLTEHHKPCSDCHKNDTCDRCHFEDGQPAPATFDHARTGWELNRYHRDRSCRACHVTAPFEKQDSRCNACHQGWNSANFDHAVTGQQLDDQHSRLECETCHIDRAFDRPPSCSECHEPDENVAFPAKRPGPVVEPRNR